MNGKWITIMRVSELRWWQRDASKQLSTSELQDIMNQSRNNPKHTFTVSEGIDDEPNELELAILKTQDRDAALNVIVQQHGIEWVKQHLPK